MLAILSTHPIQYQVPVWQALARDGRVPFEVWYLTDHATQPTRDREFGRTFAWDIETLSGYTHRFLKVSESATPASFWKCRLHERLRDRLRGSGARVLWIQGWQVFGYWQAVHEARCASIQVWLRAESNNLAPQAPWKRRLKKLRNGWLFRRVDKFLYIGEANRRLYLESGISEARLYRAPYAVDNHRFAVQAAALRNRRLEIRNQWRIGEDAFCILFCGKFIPKKRPLDVVAAVRKLLQNLKIRNVHLLFVGSGILGPQLREACHVVFDAEAPKGFEGVRNYGPVPERPSASFTGFLNQTQISAAYIAADCLVLPSDYGETWGLVVNEALASGLPCLVSQACGCAEDLSTFTFPVGDVDALSSRLLDIAYKGCKVAEPPAISDTISSIVDAYRMANS